MRLKELGGKDYETVILPIKKARLGRNGPTRILDVFVDEFEEVLIGDERRRKFEESVDREWIAERLRRFERGENDVAIADKDHPLRFSAGGLLWKINEWFVFIMRDDEAPSYQNRLTACTGLASSYMEILDPEKVMLREGLEEVKLIIRGKRATPNLSGRGEVPARTYYGRHPSVINTIVGKDFLISSKECILHVDPATGAIEHLGLLEVRVEEEFSLEDGEEVNGKPLNREIFLIHERDVERALGGGEVRSRLFRDGEEKGEVRRSFRFTPTAEAILREYRNP